MFYNIGNKSYVRWEDIGADESNAIYVRFYKKKQTHLECKPSKNAIKLIPSYLVGLYTNVVTDVLQKKKDFFSYKHELEPILPWTIFKNGERDPLILSLLVPGSVIVEDDVMIPAIWCWYNLFDKFHNLTLTSLKEWVEKTPSLVTKFGQDYEQFFEHEHGPGVSDVESIDDNIYVKVMYVLRYRCQQ
jgi:hypothetical protein